MTSSFFHKTRARWTRVAGGPALAEARAQHQETLRKVAHDLRNPLNSILLMAQLLEEVGGTPDTQRIAKRIQRQCEEMNSLVNQAVGDLPG